MHSQHLSSLEGIELCRNIEVASFSANRIDSLIPIKAIHLLKFLDVKTNRIMSLRGIEHCEMLVKLDASHNLITSLDGLSEMQQNHLEYINLAANKLDSLDFLACLDKYTFLKELYFEKGKATNYFCSNK